MSCSSASAGSKSVFKRPTDKGIIVKEQVGTKRSPFKQVYSLFKSLLKAAVLLQARDWFQYISLSKVIVIS